MQHLIWPMAYNYNLYLRTEKFGHLCDRQYPCRCFGGVLHHWWDNPLWPHQTPVGILSHPSRIPPLLCGPVDPENRRAPEKPNPIHCTETEKKTVRRKLHFHYKQHLCMIVTFRPLVAVKQLFLHLFILVKWMNNNLHIK